MTAPLSSEYFISIHFLLRKLPPLTHVELGLGFIVLYRNVKYVSGCFTDHTNMCSTCVVIYVCKASYRHWEEVGLWNISCGPFATGSRAEGTPQSSHGQAAASVTLTADGWQPQWLGNPLCSTTAQLVWLCHEHRYSCLPLLPPPVKPIKADGFGNLLSHLERDSPSLAVPQGASLPNGEMQFILPRTIGSDPARKLLRSE